MNIAQTCRSNEERRAALYSLLGDLPPRSRPISARFLSGEERGAYLLERLELDLNGEEIVPAYFVKPKLEHTGAGSEEAKPPVVLFCHSHGGKYHLGKDELLRGNTYMDTVSYASALTAQGYAVLCIDFWLFGQRSGRGELNFFKEMLWRGKVVWGMMAYDHLRAIDYLFTRDDIDTGRLAVLGMSMGSTMAWWLAALDERVKVCVDICCMTDFQSLIDADGLDGHGIYYYVPALLKHFSTAEINALIAPRPHLALAGTEDNLTPAAGLDKVDKLLKQIYAEQGAEQAWELKKYPVAHQETPEMRTAVMDYLRRWL